MKVPDVKLMVPSPDASPPQTFILYELDAVPAVTVRSLVVVELSRMVQAVPVPLKVRL